MEERNQMNEDEIISRATNILYGRLLSKAPLTNYASSYHDVVKYLRFKISQKEHEVFGILFYNARMQLISQSELFRGSITHCPVHVREVVRECMQHNAAFIVLYHNHPSGCEINFSPSDKELTTKIAVALEMFEVKVVDHILISGSLANSYSQMGWEILPEKKDA